MRHAQQQYENELRKSEDQQVKAERVIKRLQADYDERIAVMEFSTDKTKLIRRNSIYLEPRTRTTSKISSIRFLSTWGKQSKFN